MNPSERPKKEALSPSLDPLDGFRRIANDEYDALENEVMAFRALAEDDEDLENLAYVLKRNKLLDELAKQSSVIRRLAAHANRVMEEACGRWMEVSDPRHQQAVDAHRDARAARLVIDWIEDQISAGNQAERQLET